jgi:hypothetical protein
MEPITRHARDIAPDERRALEHVLGRQLEDNQQVIIRVVAPDQQSAGAEPSSPPGKLPDWCNVFEGLTGEQLAEVEQAILERSNLTRPSP